MTLRLETRARSLAGELLECWWNGKFGQDQRSDLWLKRFGTAWCVEARHGGIGAVRHRNYFGDEISARELLDSLKAEHGQNWKWVPKG